MSTDFPCNHNPLLTSVYFNKLSYLGKNIANLGLKVDTEEREILNDLL